MYHTSRIAPLLYFVWRNENKRKSMKQGRRSYFTVESFPKHVLYIKACKIKDAYKDV